MYSEVTLTQVSQEYQMDAQDWYDALNVYGNFACVSEELYNSILYYFDDTAFEL